MNRYGPAHRRLRAAWAPAVERGEVACAKVWNHLTNTWSGCGHPIHPGQVWNLGHRPGGGPDDYVGPQHERCNKGDGARNGNRLRKRARLRTSEDW